MKQLLSILLTVLSTYHAGVYETVGEIEMTCSQAEAQAVMDKIMFDFEHDPHHVWEWMFWGTGEQRDERKQGFVIHYDTVRYDAPTEKLHIDMTLISPRGKTSDLHVEPTLSDSHRSQDKTETGQDDIRSGNKRQIYFGVDNFKNLVKHADATLTLIPSADPNPNAVGTQRLKVVTHCKFGWFFNLFISRKMYRNTVEWRVEQFLQNLRCTAEKKPLTSIKVELEE